MTGLNAYYLAAAVLGVGAAIALFDRVVYWRTRALTWRREWGLEREVVKNQASVIRRYENTLGRHPGSEWAPKRHRAVDTSEIAPTSDWLAEWLTNESDHWRCPAAHLGETFIPLEAA